MGCLNPCRGRWAAGYRHTAWPTASDIRAPGPFDIHMAARWTDMVRHAQYSADMLLNGYGSPVAMAACVHHAIL
jgi:hypothetical protein